MATPNRAAQFAKLHKIAKKHFPPVAPSSQRLLLEHMLYACCLENSKFDAADEAFARLQQDYFDWNEIRVTTVNELAEVMSCLAEPADAAMRLKKTLHSMFEIHYAFDLESLRKENLGKAVQHLGKFQGITPFVVAYLTQVGLGGHAIPIDKATAALLSILELVTPKEAIAFQVPGLERAIPKNKGPEFFSCIHQLAAALYASPFNNDVRNIVLEIDSSAKPRLPKRGPRKPEPAAEAASANSDRGAPLKPSKGKATSPDEKPKKGKDKEKEAATAKRKGPEKASPPAASAPPKPTKSPGKSVGKAKPPKASSPTRQLAKKKPR